MSPNFAGEWLGGAKLADFLNVTVMTIWRWERDTKLNFPKPSIINNRKYWSREAIDRWMRSKATGKLTRIF
jgi:predicted DNA-binding transcriptional regulator AlpA